MIVTDRLEIKPYFATLENIRLNVKWLNDPAVVRYSEQRHRLHTIATQTDYEENFRPPNKLLGIYVTKTFIGTMAIYIDEMNKLADVGIMIGDRAYWGKGYGYEAWQATCDDLLANGIRKVEGGCMNTNAAMIRIFLKYGMNFEGERKNHFHIDGDKRVGMLMAGKFK